MISCTTEKMYIDRLHTAKTAIFTELVVDTFANPYEANIQQLPATLNMGIQHTI